MQLDHFQDDSLFDLVGLKSQQKLVTLPSEKHLLDNPDYAKLYNDDMFQIISRARSSFQLAVFELIYIQTKKPPLRHCEDKRSSFSLLDPSNNFAMRHLCLSCAYVFLTGLFRSTTGYIFSIVFFRILILRFYTRSSVRRLLVCCEMFAYIKHWVY